MLHQHIKIGFTGGGQLGEQLVAHCGADFGIALGQIVLLVWIAGLIWPHQIHVDFHPATSYQVTVFYWIYPGLLIGTILATLMLPPESGWNYSGVMERLQNEPDHPEN